MGHQYYFRTLPKLNQGEKIGILVITLASMLTPLKKLGAS
jgi:hypothetical protein